MRVNIWLYGRGCDWNYDHINFYILLPMSRFTLSDLSPAMRAQAVDQLSNKPDFVKYTPRYRDGLPSGNSGKPLKEPKRVIVPRGTNCNKAKYNPRVITAYFEQCGLPTPVYEIRFDKVRRWQFDIAWPALKIALEVEGGIWSKGSHSRPQGIIRDICKYNQAQCLGWRVLRVVPELLCTNGTIEMVKKCMANHG